MRRFWVAIALVTIIGMPVLSACTPSKVDVTAEQKTQCYQNERLIKTAMDLFFADSQMYPPLEQVVTKLDAKCPSGGTYTFNEKTDVVDCSVHGHPQ